MRRLSLRMKSGMYVLGFTLFFILTLIGAIGFGFNHYFYESKKAAMVDASRQISRIYAEQGQGGEEDIDMVSQNVGVDVLIVDNRQLVYSSRPSRRVWVSRPKMDENDVVVVVGKETEAQKHDANAKMPQHIRELMALLHGQEPDASTIGKVRFYELDNNFRYYDLVTRMDNGAYLLMICPLAPMQESIYLVQKFIITCGVIWLIVAVIGTVLLTNKMISPLLELKRLSVAMAHLDFTKKWQGTQTDEIGELGASLNALSAQLDEALKALKQSNAELQKQLDKAKEVEHMRQSFIFAVSHELKTPLAIIQGYAEGLNSLQIDEAARERYCHVIQSETEKMDNLVKSLLNLSRLETGSFRLEKTVFDFSALADEAKDRFANVIQKKKISMTWDIPDEMTVFGDPEQMDSVLGNFLSNAIDYTPVGGKIVVSSKEGDDAYTVSIYNQGIQIPEECQTRIWEPFYKVDTARSRNVHRTFGGHGLGLGIVSALLKLHGQQYGVRNEADGVTFWFTIEKRTM